MTITKRTKEDDEKFESTLVEVLEEVYRNAVFKTNGDSIKGV